MTTEAIETHNMLETVEEYLSAQNWRFMRPSDEEIFVELKGSAGTYKLFFLWDDSTASLQLCCEMDVQVADAQAPALYKMLAEINTKMWLGHFDMTSDNASLTPCFRYTGLYRGMPEGAAGQMVDDLIQLAMTECDRTRHAFTLMAEADATTQNTALFDLALAAPRWSRLNNHMLKVVPTPLHILVIGYGNMGLAIAKGWDTLDAKPILTIIDPNSDKAHYKSLTDLPKGQNFDAVLLAVKPQVMPDVLPLLKPYLHRKTIVITIAAGLPLSMYQAVLGKNQPLVRAMPNTPAAIGLGVTAIYCNDMDMSEQEKLLELFLPCGPVEWVENEDDFHAITALSGSGPAYVFHLIEAMHEAGVKAGLPDYLAASLARQTVIGSAALADTMHEMDVSDLRQAVTSPNGTTEAGLSVLMPELTDLMTRTIARATARSRELSGGAK